MHWLGACTNAPYIGVIHQIMLALHSTVELVYVPHIGGTQWLVGAISHQQSSPIITSNHQPKAADLPCDGSHSAIVHTNETISTKSTTMQSGMVNQQHWPIAWCDGLLQAKSIPRTPWINHQNSISNLRKPSTLTLNIHKTRWLSLVCTKQPSNLKGSVSASAICSPALNCEQPRSPVSPSPYTETMNWTAGHMVPLICLLVLGGIVHMVPHLCIGSW